MTKPEHTRPFDIKAARAGAPYCCENGKEATIFKWDARYPGRPLLGACGPSDEAMGWSASGGSSYSSNHNLVMLPLGTCQGKPVFVGDVLIDPNGTFGGDEEFTVGPTMRQGHIGHCKWPEPDPVYPETTCKPDELAIAYGNGLTFLDCLLAVANSAIRRAIDDGQVVRAEDVNQKVIDGVMKSGRRNLVQEELLEKVANAVRAFFIQGLRNRGYLRQGEPQYQTGLELHDMMANFNLDAVIADVKAGKV